MDRQRRGAVGAPVPNAEQMGDPADNWKIRRDAVGATRREPCQELPAALRVDAPAKRLRRFQGLRAAHGDHELLRRARAGSARPRRGGFGNGRMELTGQALTVLITDDTDDGQDVIDLAEQWHDLGLLDDFAIVTPRSIVRSGHGPAEISTHVVGGEGQLDLMAHLGSRRRRLIRLVVLHMLTHEDSSADRLVSACNQVARLVQRAMPIRAAADDSDGMRLLRINLLVPESDVAPQSVDILQPGWEINAVVSPEDRPDLDRLSVFVRAGTNLHGHALAAAASVGGLWRGMSKAVFDSHELDSTGGAHDVVVLRCNTKRIVGDDRAELLTSAALDAVVGEDDGAVRHIAWGYPSDRPTEVVDRLLSTLMNEQEWAPLEREYPPLQTRTVPMRLLLADWSRFQAALPMSAIGFLTGRAISAVERGVTNAVIGADAGVIGRIVPLSPQEASRRASSRLHELSRELEPGRLSEAAATWGQSTPAAWRILREVAIGQVDGSDVAARIRTTAPSESRRGPAAEPRGAATFGWNTVWWSRNHPERRRRRGRPSSE